MEQTSLRRTDQVRYHRQVAVGGFDQTPERRGQGCLQHSCRIPTAPIDLPGSFPGRAAAAGRTIRAKSMLAQATMDEIVPEDPCQAGHSFGCCRRAPARRLSAGRHGERDIREGRDLRVGWLVILFGRRAYCPVVVLQVSFAAEGQPVSPVRSDGFEDLETAASAHCLVRK